MKIRTLLLLLVVAACTGEGSPDVEPGADAQPPEYEPPVALNAVSAVEYPVDLFEQRVEGTVLLRLYLLDDGTVVPDSTAIAESSGNTALDSAALAGVPRMTFAPARRMGVPVETVFMQPVYFRHPEGAATGANGQ